MTLSDTERDLSARSSLAIVVVDDGGIVRSSSARHAWRLGRRVDEVVGQDSRRWLDGPSLAAGLRSAARALAGEPQSFSLAAVRQDGRLALSRLHLTRLRTRAHGTCLLGVHTGIFIAEPAAGDPGLGPAAASNLVHDLAAELAVMASTSGLVSLAASLEAVAGEVGDMALRLAAAATRPLP